MGTSDHSGASPPPGFRLSAEEQSGVILVRVAGELDLASAPRLMDAIDQASAWPGAVPVVIDLAHVSFMDSTGVRSLLAADRMRRDTGRPLALLKPSHPVTRVLDLVELRSLFVEIEDLAPDSIALVEGRATSG